MSELQLSKQKNTEMTWTWTNPSLRWNCRGVGAEPLHYEMSLVPGEKDLLISLIPGGVMKIWQGRAIKTSTLWPGTRRARWWDVGCARGRGGTQLTVLPRSLFFTIWRHLGLDAEILWPCSEDRNPTNSSVSWHIVFKQALDKFSFPASSRMFFFLSSVIFSMYFRAQLLLSSSFTIFWKFAFFTVYIAKETIKICMVLIPNVPSTLFIRFLHFHFI